MDARERYRTFCRTEPTLPLFLQDWWLDALTEADGSCWDVRLLEDQGEIRGAWPFVWKRRYGFSKIVMPPLTPFMGPWLAPSRLATPVRQLWDRTERLTALANLLPRVDDFHQKFSVEMDYWLPLHWMGFEQTTRYTFRIEPLADPETRWNQLGKSVRKSLRQAREQGMTVHPLPELELFYAMVKQVYAAQRQSPPFSLAYLRRLDAALHTRGQRELFFAFDANRQPIAGLYLVWDRTTAWLLHSGKDPARRTPLEGLLLVWHAIQYAGETLGLQVFDFEGSMIERICRFHRNFGPLPRPYFQITRTESPLLRTWYMLRKLRGHP